MEQRWLTGGAVGVIGLLLAAVQIAHAIQQTDIAIAIVVDAVPFVSMGLGVAFVGYWMARESAFDGQAERVALWAVGGIIAMASVAALVLFGQRVTTGTLDRATYLTIDLVTVGALGGALVGLYDARSRRRRTELAAERDRIETFAGKAADVNNYGRAIYSARSVDGVAAYLVQAVETLIDLRQTAVARVDGDDVELVADTTRDVDREALTHLARDALGSAPRDVAVKGEDPDVELPASLTTTVTTVLYEDDDTAVVLVALGAEAGEIAEEDRQLLELVVAHAAATIQRLEPAPEQHR